MNIMTNPNESTHLIVALCFPSGPPTSKVAIVWLDILRWWMASIRGSMTGSPRESKLLRRGPVHTRHARAFHQSTCFWKATWVLTCFEHLRKCHEMYWILDFTISLMCKELNFNESWPISKTSLSPVGSKLTASVSCPSHFGDDVTHRDWWKPAQRLAIRAYGTAPEWAIKNCNKFGHNKRKKVCCIMSV